MRSVRNGGAVMAMARSVGDRRAQMALMALVVGRSQELLQAAPGRRWNCGGLNISSVMILSVDAAMRMEAASSVSSAEGGCWVTASREMRSPCQAPGRSMGSGGQ